LVDAHADGYSSPVAGASPLEFVGVLFIVIVWFVMGLLFLMVAARIVTRVVLDEIDKGRRRRGDPR
jgi:hypothetical protein